MADLGYRSVEIHVVNNTKADLSVQSAATIGPSSAWISGEQADSGQVVKQWGTVRWGVFTHSGADAPSATISLVGLGNEAIQINLINQPDGTSPVTANSNDEVQSSIVQMDSGEDSHTMWKVALSPPS
jgi:hypothetical protein